MHCDLLKHYAISERRHLSPLAVDILLPDYFLYLYAGHDAWYVVAEADYFLVIDIPRDIERSFPVKVEGWCTLVKYKEKSGVKLLAANVFKNENVNESDEDWEHYHGVVYQDGGYTFALLRVKPKAGVGIGDFGLSFFKFDT